MSVIVKHTDCSMLRLNNEDLQAKIKEDLGADATGMDFLPFAWLEDAVREDVAFLKFSPLVGDDVAARGFVYDVTTGRVSEVDGPPDPRAGASPPPTRARRRRPRRRASRSPRPRR